MDNIKASYFAGFFDGEGSAFEAHYKDRHGKDRVRLTASVAQVDRKVLDLLVEELGFGTVQRKHDKRAIERGWKPAYDVRVSDRAARELLTILEPFLIVKKENVTELLDKHGRDIERRSTKRAQ